MGHGPSETTRTCLPYLSADAGADAGQCAEEGGGGALPEAGLVLANSRTYFSMSGSGKRAGPEPYFTYLRGRHSGALLPRLSYRRRLADTRCFCVKEESMKRLLLSTTQYLMLLNLQGQRISNKSKNS